MMGCVGSRASCAGGRRRGCVGFTAVTRPSPDVSADVSNDMFVEHTNGNVDIEGPEGSMLRAEVLILQQATSREYASSHMNCHTLDMQPELTLHKTPKAEAEENLRKKNGLHQKVIL